ncbi:MAG: phytanoyl-CoA dioxygenase family protein [Gammaproteobacteria bacterium]
MTDICTPTPTGPLSSDQMGDYREKGFVVVPGLLDRQRMREIQDWADDIAMWPEVPGKYMLYFEGDEAGEGNRFLNRAEDITSYHQGLHALMESPEMIGAATQLFGEPAVLFKDKINFKMPGGCGFESHQDVQAGWDAYADMHITAMLSIDAGTVENGCLEFAARHHMDGLIGSSWQPLSDVAIPEKGFQKIITEPGDAVFFGSYTPHRSAANRTDKPRRIAYFTYNKFSQGDHRRQYYADKRASYPPDIERLPDVDYRFRV